jgi:hypothetical protein
MLIPCGGRPETHRPEQRRHAVEGGRGKTGELKMMLRGGECVRQDARKVLEKAGVIVHKGRLDEEARSDVLVARGAPRSLAERRKSRSSTWR